MFRVRYVLFYFHDHKEFFVFSFFVYSQYWANMRFHESMGILNNANHNLNSNNNNNNFSSNYNDHSNSNLNSNLNSDSNLNANTNANTVKTFTSNGNYQAFSTSPYSSAYSTADITDYSNEISNYNTQQNLETVFNNALLKSNDSNCFYGSYRRLKLRENVNNANNVNDVERDENLNGNLTKIDIGGNDDCSDIESEINRLINRSNLCRQNFECGRDNNRTTHNFEDNFMDEEGN